MVLGDARWDQLPERTRHLLRAEGAAFCADMASGDSRFVEIDLLRIPGLVGCGDEYPDFVDVNARTAEEAGFEFLVIAGAGHYAPISNPEIGATFVRATVELAHRASQAGH